MLMTRSRIAWLLAFLVSVVVSLAACSGSSGGSGGNSGSGGTGNGGTTSSAGGTGGAGGTATTSTGGTGQLDPTAFGQKYEIADNQIPGWTLNQTPDQFDPLDVYAADSLALDRIDGAAPAYVDRGCRVAMYEQMVGPSPTQCVVIAMDFGTDANATSMFDYEKQYNSASVQISPYDASTAIGYTGMTSCQIYAHFKASYFELEMDGYGSDPTAGCQAGTAFLQVLEAKTK